MRQWKLRYDSPATRWTEALPLGNGSLGAMVYGGCSQERIALNLDTLWSGCGREKGNPGKADWEKIRRLLFMHRHKEAEELIQKEVLGDWTEAYLPAGDLWLRLETQEDKAKEYLRELNLNEGLYRNVFTVDNHSFQKEIFTSLKEKLLVVCLWSTQKIPFDAEVSLTSPLKYEIEKGERPGQLVLSGQAPSYAAPIYYSCEEPIRYDQEGLRFGLRLSLCTEQGEIIAESGKLKVRGATKLTIYLAGDTNFSAEEEDYIRKDEHWERALMEAVRRGEEKGVEQLRREHIQEHRSYFERMELELGEAGEEQEKNGCRTFG
ncbi:MAG: glycoside hydrolase N-terminal domain-containing protein [Lachnospiraceae bacterium]